MNDANDIIGKARDVEVTKIKNDRIEKVMERLEKIRTSGKFRCVWCGREIESYGYCGLKCEKKVVADKYPSQKEIEIMMRGVK
jgi:tRNA(Ile2) C34 agmatinyltransferase TiaS